MYVNPNYRTKKALVEALKSGSYVQVFQPNADLTRTVVPRDGTVSLEGPHYPKAHTWYAVGTMKDGRLIKVR